MGEPAPQLSANQLEEFEQRGVLTFDPGFDPNFVELVADATRGFWPHKPLFSAYYDPNRIQDAWVHSAPVRALALHRNVIGAVEQLYGRAPAPFQTLNFRVGTQQPAHSDTVHFNSVPFGAMCGVWVALQDVGPDDGPLVYYPGSHRLPEMNFADFGLPSSFDHYPRYEQKLAELIDAEGFAPETACVKQGQAVVWAANLLHGGMPLPKPRTPRLSQVTHYYFRGDKYWRPRLSGEERHFYNPQWVTYDPLYRAGIGIRRLIGRAVGRLRGRTH